MVAQMTDWRREAGDAPALRPLAVSPPALRSCVTRPGATPPILEAMGSQHDLPA